MRSSSTLFTLVLAGCLSAGCLQAPDGDRCECPLEGPACASFICDGGECVVEILEGTLPEIQVTGDCQTLSCNGAEEPEVIADPTDIPDDDNPCTEELCTEQGLTVHELPPGTPCGNKAFCDNDAQCYACDDGNACTTEECLSGPLVVTSTLPPGASCGADSYCSLDGYCYPCDDGNACSAEDCSSGELVVTDVLPPGANCGDGAYCDVNGECQACDEGNACTADDCSSGTPVHTALPDGGSCGEGFCSNGTCVTWCLPLPDPATCPDTGAYEATDDVWSGEPQFPDDDGAPVPICGVLTPGDEDWISYHAADRAFEYDVNSFLFWSFDQSLRVCSFAKCSAGPTSAPCYDGGTPTVGPEGQPGCCWQGVFNQDAAFSMNLECSGSNDSGWVRLRIDNPDGLACAPYALRDYGY